MIIIKESGIIQGREGRMKHGTSVYISESSLDYIASKERKRKKKRERENPMSDRPRDAKDRPTGHKYLTAFSQLKQIILMRNLFN